MGKMGVVGGDDRQEVGPGQHLLGGVFAGVHDVDFQRVGAQALGFLHIHVEGGAVLHHHEAVDLVFRPDAQLLQLAAAAHVLRVVVGVVGLADDINPFGKLGVGGGEVFFRIPVAAIEQYTVHETVVGEMCVNLGTELLHVVFGHDYDGLTCLFLTKRFEHVRQVTVGAEDEDVAFHPIAHDAGLGRVGDVVEDVVDHRDQQGGEQQNAHYGYDEAEAVVLASAAEAAWVEKQGQNVLPSIIPSQYQRDEHEKHEKHHHRKQQQQ